MRTDKITKLVTAALMAAMTCVTTMIIAVPSPAGGYIHPGDAFVLLSGIILGPFYGGLAAGIGSMLADLLLGYSGYALATLIIKGMAAIVGVSVFRLLRRNHKPHILPLLFAGIFDGITVTIGYFIFESFLLGLGLGTAILNVPANLVQNTFGILVSILLFPLLLKVPQIRSIMDNK
ncbi:MAG: ECF transporter S component [Mobilitalea sp.]